MCVNLTVCVYVCVYVCVCVCVCMCVCVCVCEGRTVYLLGQYSAAEWNVYRAGLFLQNNIILFSRVFRMVSLVSYFKLAQVKLIIITLNEMNE